MNCVELVKVTTKLLFLQISWLVCVSPVLAPGSNGPANVVKWGHAKTLHGNREEKSSELCRGPL